MELHVPWWRNTTRRPQRARARRIAEASNACRTALLAADRPIPVPADGLHQPAAGIILSPGAQDLPRVLDARAADVDDGGKAGAGHREGSLTFNRLERLLECQHLRELVEPCLKRGLSQKDWVIGR